MYMSIIVTATLIIMKLERYHLHDMRKVSNFYKHNFIIEI